MFEPADRTEAAFAALVAGVPAGSDAPALPPPSPELQALLGAVSAVADRTPGALPGPQSLADTAALLQAVERLNASLLSHVADVDARQLHAHDGAGSTATWIARQQTGFTRDDVALARRLSRLPRLDQAVRDGELCLQSAGRLARALAQVRPHVDRPDGLIDGQDGEQVVTAVVVDGVRMQVCQALGGLADDDPRLVGLGASLEAVARRPVSQLARLEEGFLLLAQHVEPALLPGALGMLVDATLPQQLERRAEEGHRRRRLELGKLDDESAWWVKGHLDLECGELLATALDAGMLTDPDRPSDTAGYEQLRADGWQAGDELPACDGPRTVGQRRHDALQRLLERYLDSGTAGAREKVAPHIAVTVGLDTLHAAPGALPAVAASGTRLPLSLVRAWFADSAVTRFVLGLGHRVVASSHTGRTLTAHERRIKQLETGGRCQAAGCSAGPGRRLIPHHPVAYAVCGTTSLRDTVLLCDQSHHDLHSGRRTLRLKDGRWLDADGWTEGPGRWDRTGR